MRAAAVLVSVAALALTGCGAAVGPTPTGRPAGSAAQRPGSAGPVTVERSGGIAGVRDQVVVRGDDGTWRRTAREVVTGTGTLTPDERGRMRLLVSDPALREEAGQPTPATSCADGFHYEVTVGLTAVAWTDCGPAAGGPATAANIASLLLGVTE